MKRSTVRLELKKSEFWKMYLKIMNPILKLQNKEQEVLACIILVAVANRNNTNLESKLLDYNSRVKIRSYLKMSEASLNNIISDLKKKKLLIKTDLGFKVHDNFMKLDFINGHTVEFLLSIK